MDFAINSRGDDIFCDPTKWDFFEREKRGARAKRKKTTPCRAFFFVHNKPKCWPILSHFFWDIFQSFKMKVFE